MTIREKVKNTRIEERPLINFNGTVSHMDDTQYEDYLKSVESTQKFTPPPDPIEELRRTQLEQDAALMELAEMLTGGV